MAVAITRTADQLATTAGIAGNTATYSGLSIGTAASDRIVAVAISYEVNATISGVTIDGVAMKQAAQVLFSTTVGSGIYWTHWPIGTTATFALTLSAAPTTTNHHITIFSVTGANVAINTAQTNTSTDMDASAPLSIAITIPTSGAALAVASSASDTTTHTWANMTGDLDVDAGTGRHTTGTRTTAGSVTTTLTGTTNAEDGALVIATFAPASATGTTTGSQSRVVRPHYNQRYMPHLRSAVNGPPPTFYFTRTDNPAGVSAGVDTVTYSGVNIGTPSPDRLVVLAISGRIIGAETTTYAVTIDSGDGASSMQWYHDGSGAEVGSTIAWKHVPFGTTATITVRWRFGFGPDSTHNHISVYTLRGSATTPSYKNSTPQTDLTAPTPLNFTINAAGGGAFFLCTSDTSTSNAKTWSSSPNPSITEDLEVAAGSLCHTTAVRYTPGTLSTALCTGTSSGEDAAFIVTAFDLASTVPFTICDALLSWQRPAPYPNNLRTWVNAPQPVEGVAATYVPARVVDWGMWLDPRVPRTWTGLPTPTADQAAVPVPIVQSDWPLPRRAVWPVWTWTQATPPETATIPSQVIAWDVPDRVDVAPRTWLQAPQLIEVIVPPEARPAYNTWQLPIAPYRIQQTWTQTPFSGTPLPCNQYSWPVPIAPFRMPQTWAWAQFRGTAVPANQYSWPLPIQPTRPLRSYGVAPQPAEVVVVSAKPVVQTDWPLPIQRASDAITFVESPLATPVQKPYNKYDWPLPPQTPRRAITFVRGAIGRSNIPANQYDWPLPLRRVPWSRTWLQAPNPASFPIQAKPVNQYNWPLPIRRVQAAITWSRSPIFAAPKVFSIMPSRVVDWGTTPAARTMSATTWTRTPMFAAEVLPEKPPPGDISTALPAAHDYPIALRSWTNSGIKVETVFRAPYYTPKWKKPYFSYDLPPNMVAALNAPIPPPPKPPLTAVFPPPLGHPYPINLRSIARPPQITVLPPEPLPQNQYNWPIPRAHSRKSDGYTYTFNFYTGRQSPANMPPRTGVFAYPVGPYFPMSLRTILGSQQNEIPPSEPSVGGIPHNIPFIATMGAMTAR